MRCSIAATRRSKRRSTRSPKSSPKAQLPDGYLNCWYHRPRDREPLDQPPRQPRALLRRPHAGRRHRLFPGDRPPPAARHHAPLRRPHRRGLRPGRGPEARLLRAPGDRARADQALPRDRRAKAPRSRRLLHQRARAPAALFRHRGARARRRSRRNSGRRPTNTTSRTSRCASRTRSSATRCARMYMYAAMADLAAELGDDVAEARLRGAVAGRHLEADVRDGRPRPGGRQRGLHRPTTTCRTTPPMPRPAPRSR